MLGITEWDTPQGIHILQIHYTADEAKRSEEWKQMARKGISEADWQREYEINFDVHPGKQWYPEFRLDYHVAKEPIKPLEGRTVFLGWDYGQTFNPAIVCCQTSVYGQLLVLSTLYGMDAGLHPFAKAVKVKMAEYIPRPFTHIGDPAGNNRSPNDEKSANTILREEYNINIQPGPVAFGTRSEAIRKLLTQTTPQGQAILLIDPSCTHLIGGFTGGYHRKQVGNVLLEEPDKNEYSHEMDALGYVAASIFNFVEDKWKNVNIPIAGGL
jgi:hypothetical protein